MQENRVSSSSKTNEADNVRRTMNLTQRFQTLAHLRVTFGHLLPRPPRAHRDHTLAHFRTLSITSLSLISQHLHNPIDALRVHGLSFSVFKKYFRIILTKNIMFCIFVC